MQEIESHHRHRKPCHREVRGADEAKKTVNEPIACHSTASRPARSSLSQTGADRRTVANIIP